MSPCTRNLLIITGKDNNSTPYHCTGTAASSLSADRVNPSSFGRLQNAHSCLVRGCLLTYLFSKVISPRRKTRGNSNQNYVDGNICLSSVIERPRVYYSAGVRHPRCSLSRFVGFPILFPFESIPSPFLVKQTFLHVHHVPLIVRTMEWSKIRSLLFFSSFLVIINRVVVPNPSFSSPSYSKKNLISS